MLVIVEGVNGVGKSTFVDLVADRLREKSGPNSVDVLHKGPPKSSDMITEYLSPLEEYVPERGHHIICDRWHLGELVYGPILRGKSLLNEFDLWEIEQNLLFRRALIVLLTAELEVVQHRRETRDKVDLIRDDQVEPIANMFRSVVNESDVEHLVVPWTHAKMSTVNRVIASAQRVEETEWRP